MAQPRTDLAAEAHELWQQGAGNAGNLSGVRAEDQVVEGFSVHQVHILDQSGAQALGKPPGRYFTVELDGLLRREEDAFPRAVSALARLVEPLLPARGDALVVGLGNRQITPDAIGPKTADALLVTRHLVKNLSEQFADLRPVAALAAGVAGTTGMESGEIVGAMVKKLKPACLIAVDALAARCQERVCRTIQVADTGIVPGSGVGNARMALDEETLGIPVLAVGVPTVVDAGTLCMDLMEETGQDFDPAVFRTEGAEWFVTPRNVDQQVSILSRILGLGISTALHVDFSVEDVEKWTS